MRYGRFNSHPQWREGLPQDSCEVAAKKVVGRHLFFIFCCVLRLVSRLVLLPALGYLEGPQHAFSRVHRLHCSLVCSWESGSFTVARDFLCYRFCRVDKGTVTATTPANLRLLALAPGSRPQSQLPISRNRPRGFGGFHIDGNAVYQAAGAILSFVTTWCDRWFDLLPSGVARRYHGPDKERKT
jgi:hypothetical protein